jgi:hypothetical protein
MNLHRYDLDVPLDALVADTRRAVERWDWSRGAYGHALSLPAYRQLHPHARYGYENFPCAGLLDECPVLGAIFDGLECEKVSFRLLRRGPGSAYGWHTDRWKGEGVARFQIPIVSDQRAFLVTTDYEKVDQLGEQSSERLSEDSFATLADAHAGHVRRHRLEPGRLHYFDTSRVHTLVNPGPSERITLSFDLVANDWLLARFPAIRGEIGNGATGSLPRPGPVANALAFARSRFYPLRTRASRWSARRAGQEA